MSGATAGCWTAGKYSALPVRLREYVLYGIARSVNACAAVNKNRLWQGLVGFPDSFELLVAYWRTPAVGNRNASSLKPIRAVVIKEPARHRCVQIQLVVREETDDPLDS